MLRKKIHQIRGTAIVETAYVMPLLLAYMMALIFLGYAGLSQLELDAATYQDAHARFTLGNSPFNGEYFSNITQGSNPIDRQITNNLAFAQGASFQATSYMPVAPLTNPPDGNWNSESRLGLNDLIEVPMPLQVVTQKNWTFSTGFTGTSWLNQQSVATETNVVTSGWQTGFTAGGGWDGVWVGNGGSSYSSGQSTELPIVVIDLGINVCRAEKSPPAHWGPTCPGDQPTLPLVRATYSTTGIGDAMLIDKGNETRSTQGVAAGSTFWETRYHQNVFRQLAKDLAARGNMPTTQSSADTWANTTEALPNVKLVEQFDTIMPNGSFQTAPGSSM